MSFVILAYFLLNVIGFAGWIPRILDEIVETKIVKVHQIIVLVLLLPTTIIVLVIVLIYEIFRRLGFKKLFSKIVKLMNKKVINFNKK